MKAIVVLLLPSLLLAYVAKVVSLDGDVRVHQAAIQTPLLPNDTLEQGSRVVTASGSKVKLLFVDETMVTIGPNSEFLVEDYRASESDKKAFFKIKRGVFKVLTGTIAKVAPERFKIKTKTGTIGVRGTYFAGQYKDDTLGLLYLGKGHGVVITNDAGETVLDEIGDGVFMTQYQVPPRKEQWNSEQAHDLLQQLTMADETEEELIETKQYRLGAELRYMYQYMGMTPPDTHKDRHEGIAIVRGSTPQWLGLHGNAEVYHRHNLYNNDFETDYFSVVGDVNVEYSSTYVTAVVGRQQIDTPFTGVSKIRPDFKVSSFAAWDRHASTYDWFWTLPTNFEAAYAKVTAWEDLRLHAAYIDGMRQGKDDAFVDISERVISPQLDNDDNSSEMVMVGAQYILADTLKTEYWAYILHDLFITHYLEMNYRYNFDDVALLAAGQLLKQDGIGRVNQEINSWLLGARLGMEYAGAFVAANYTQTSSQNSDEINFILTPFDGTPAFTDSFAVRNTYTAMGGENLFRTDGAYGSDTTAYQVTAGYDFNRLGLFGLSTFVDYAVYDKKVIGESTKAFTFDLTYIPPKYEFMTANLKYSGVKNDNFTEMDMEMVRFMFGVAF